MSLEELKKLAQEAIGWRNCEHAWEVADEDGYRTAVVGAISEDEKYPVITVDCALYYADDDSLKVAKFIAAANPGTVVELIADAARYRHIRQRDSALIPPTQFDAAVDASMAETPNAGAPFGQLVRLSAVTAMNPIERLKQFLGKASFSSEGDWYSALECLAEIERENGSVTAPVEAAARPAVWVEPKHLAEQQHYGGTAGFGMVVITNTAQVEGKIPLYAIPEGWQLVPKEPTEKMLRAAAIEDADAFDNIRVADIYRVMLRHVPAPNAEFKGG